MRKTVELSSLNTVQNKTAHNIKHKLTQTYIVTGKRTHKNAHTKMDTTHTNTNARKKDRKSTRLNSSH